MFLFAGVEIVPTKTLVHIEMIKVEIRLAKFEFCAVWCATTASYKNIVSFLLAGGEITGTAGL
jgi:hypothetical protein